MDSHYYHITTNYLNISMLSFPNHHLHKPSPQIPHLQLRTTTTTPIIPHVTTQTTPRYTFLTTIPHHAFSTYRINTLLMTKVIPQAPNYHTTFASSSKTSTDSNGTTTSLTSLTNATSYKPSKLTLLGLPRPTLTSANSASPKDFAPY